MTALPVTVAQQLNPHDYKRLLKLLWDSETPVDYLSEVEPLGEHTSLCYYSLQIDGMVYFAFC